MKNIIQHLVLLIFPIFFLFAINSDAQVIDQELIYIKVEIKGLACPYCAFGMEKELKTVSGVDSVKIELKKGLAFISTTIQQQPTKEILEKVIIDAGFTPGTIEFSDSPFLIREN